MRKPYKISDGGREYIIRKFCNGESTARELSLEFNVTVQTIYNVVGKQSILARMIERRQGKQPDATLLPVVLAKPPTNQQQE